MQGDRTRYLLLAEAFTPAQALLCSPGHFCAHSRSDGALHVITADPVVWITEELLHLLHDGVHHPDVTFRCGAQDGASDVIRIEAAEGAFVYEIACQVPGHPGIWEARWPD